MVLRERPKGWNFESTRFHGPNMVSCKIVSGNQITPLIGAYIPPSTMYHLPDLEESLDRFLRRDPIIMGYMNADIFCLWNSCDQQVSDFLASLELMDFLGHFR